MKQTSYTRVMVIPVGGDNYQIWYGVKLEFGGLFVYHVQYKRGNSSLEWLCLQGQVSHLSRLQHPRDSPAPGGTPHRTIIARCDHKLHNTSTSLTHQPGGGESETRPQTAAFMSLFFHWLTLAPYKDLSGTVCSWKDVWFITSLVCFDSTSIIFAKRISVISGIFRVFGAITH